MKISIKFLVITVLLLGIGAVLGFSAKSPAKNTLTIAFSSEFQVLDPAETTATSDYTILRNVNETLVSYENGQIKPLLATSWKWAAGESKELIMNLRQGVKFHNGKEFSAEDVKFTFERMKPYDTGYTWLYKKIDHVEIVDDYTAKFVLKEPYPMFLYALTAAAGSILPKEAKVDFKTHPVGTGPYKFVEWKPGDHLTITRNEDYWGKKPSLEKIVFKIVIDATARTVALRTGEVDVVQELSYEDVPSFQKDPNFKVIAVHRPGNYQLAFNFNAGKWNSPDQDPFEDLFIRKAISYAINYDQIIQRKYGLPTRMYGPLPETMPGYPDEKTIDKYTYDLEMAKKLMARSHLPDGFSTVLLSPPEYERDAVMIQGYLEEIGINAELRVLDWGAIIPKVHQHVCEGYGMFLYARSATVPLPPQLLRKNISTYGWKPNCYFNKGYDRLYIGVESLPVEEQIQVYKDAYRYVVDRRISAWIHSWTIPWGASMKVKGLSDALSFFDTTPRLYLVSIE